MSYQSKQVQWGLLNSLNSRDNIKLHRNSMAMMENMQKASELSQQYSDVQAKIKSDYANDEKRMERALEEVKGEFDFLKEQLNVVEEQNEIERETLTAKVEVREKKMDKLQEQISKEVKQDHNIFKLGG